MWEVVIISYINFDGFDIKYISKAIHTGDSFGLVIYCDVIMQMAYRNVARKPVSVNEPLADAFTFEIPVIIQQVWRVPSLVA